MSRSSTELTGRVFCAWNARLGSELYTAEQVLEACADVRDPAARALYEAIQAVFPDQLLNAKRLGIWLRAARGEIVDAFRLDGDRDKHAGVWRWRIVRIAAEAEIAAAERERFDAEHEQRIAEFNAKVASAPSLTAKLKLIDAEQRRQRKRAAAVEKIIASAAQPRGATPRVKEALEAAKVAASLPLPAVTRGPVSVTFTFLPIAGTPSVSTARTMCFQHPGVTVDVEQTHGGQYLLTVSHDDPARLEAIRGELTRRFSFASIRSGPAPENPYATVRAGTERHLAELGVTRDTSGFDAFAQAEQEQLGRAHAERVARAWARWIG